MTELVFSARKAAPAKINLSLEVLERRPDNYHNLKSLMVTVDLCDQLSLFLRSGGPSRWSVSSDQVDLPQDENNIAYLAAMSFFDWYQIDPGDYSLDLKIQKNIPSQAGLGGGSADAAATLRLLEQAFFQGKEFEAMPASYMARKIGADVPYCYKGGTQFVSGIGDVMTELDPFPKLPLLLVKPPVNVSTQEAFAALDRSDSQLRGSELQPFTMSYKRMLLEKAYDNLNGFLDNSFLPYVISTYPEIENYFMVLEGSGSVYVSLSGSGPTIFALYEKGRDLSVISAHIRELFPQAFICATNIL